MPLENYVLGKVIGKGSYGQVSLARHKRDKKQYVIKKIDLHEASDKERTFAQQEVQILAKLKHPNIVSYKESFQNSEGFLHIVMGYCEGGDLYTKLKEQSKKSEHLGERQIVEWFVQIAMALQYMHDRNILHRDLKTQNIFLTKSKIIKVGDLGIARVLESTSDMATTLIGTPYYMSPELFSNKPYNHRSDVWALGCCVYEMTTLKHAFNARDMNALVYKILKGKTPPMPKQYSEELNGIIKSMLSYNPSERPSASKILRHPFVKKHIALFLEGTKTKKQVKEKQEKPKPEISDSKAAHPSDSGYSGSTEVNPEAIATASGIDLDIMNEDRKDIYVVAEDEEQRDEPVLSDPVVEKLKPSEKGIGQSPRDRRRSSKDSKARERKRSPVPREKEPDTEPKERKEMRGKQEEKKSVKGKIERVRSADEKDERHGKRSSHKARKQSGAHSNSPFDNPTPVRNPRPLPPGPEETPTSPNWEKRNRSLTDPIDRGEESPAQVELPKASVGVPNISARQKRRQKIKEEGLPHPALVKKSSGKSSSASASRSPGQVARPKKRVPDQKRREGDSVDGPLGSQSSVSEDDSGNEDHASRKPRSSSDGLSSPTGVDQSGADITDLIGTMQATLNMDRRPLSGHSSTSSPEGTPDSSVDVESEHKLLSSTVSGRLNDRIERLRRECIRGVGEAVLRKAFEILENADDDTLEVTQKKSDKRPSVVERKDSFIKLMGSQKFELYGDPIRQLKFCEEFAQRSM